MPAVKGTTDNDAVWDIAKHAAEKLDFRIRGRLQAYRKRRRIGRCEQAHELFSPSSLSDALSPFNSLSFSYRNWFSLALTDPNRFLS